MKLTVQHEEVLERAVSSGLFKDRTAAFNGAMRLLQEDVLCQEIRASPGAGRPIEDIDTWMSSWMNSLPCDGVVADDSRERIYEGCGE